MNTKAQRRYGPEPGGRAKEPIFGDWVVKLVGMRDRGSTFAECSSAMGTTRANCEKQFKRWGSWARRQPNYRGG